MPKDSIVNKNELWQAVLAQMQFKVSQAHFATWFKNTEILEIGADCVVVSVPNNFSKEWLENKYHKPLLKILYGLDSSIKDIKYVVGSKKVDLENIKPRVEAAEPQLDLNNFATKQETGLNPRYQFDSFVVGTSNELAHAASRGVADDPGKVYNPLFLYGGVGLGKTHLLQSIGNHVKEAFPQKKVRYCRAEKFTNDLVTALRNGSLDDFKDAYRTIDLLILDDVQFISGKEKTQEEFFHVFNILYEEGKQIVLSSDRPPKAIAALEERLRSRFTGGMIADLSLPDLETRIAILKRKVDEKEIAIPDDVLGYIADNIQSNVRELEGVLNHLATTQKLSRSKKMDLEKAEALLKKIVEKPKKSATPKKVLRVVAEFYDLKEKELIATSRKQEIVRPRQVAMYILREELKCSYPLIGRRFGGKDHTTAIYAAEKIKKELKANENLLEEINVIRQRIYSE